MEKYLHFKNPRGVFNPPQFDGLLNQSGSPLRGQILRMRPIGPLGGTPASKASCQRPAHRHQQSPSLSPGKLYSGIGVLKSLPIDLLKARNRQSFGHKLHGVHHHLNQFHSSRFETTRYLTGYNRAAKVHPVHFWVLFVQSVRSYITINGIIHLPQARNY